MISEAETTVSRKETIVPKARYCSSQGGTLQYPRQETDGLLI
jgi:hypothetical protein